MENHKKCISVKNFIFFLIKSMDYFIMMVTIIYVIYYHSVNKKIYV